MLRSVQQYLNELFETIGGAWNEFWFTPSHDGRLICLRQLVACFAFVWLLAFTSELTSMFGADGWVSADATHRVATDGDLTNTTPGFSHLFLSQNPTWIWGCHVLGLAIVGAAVVGFASRYTTPLSLIVVLSYVHRASMMATTFETVLCFLLLYVSLGVNSMSFLQWRTSGFVETRTWLTNVALRLIQVHVCAIYVLIAASKLGSSVWWSGDAVWYLLTDSQHRMLRLDVITGNTYLYNAITHGWLAFELLFPVLVWVRPLRPLVLVVSTLLWLFAAVATGQVGYCLLMATANIAFLASRRTGA